MHPILAMGDIATPVLLISLLMIDGITLITVGLFAFSLRKRSLAALVIASIFVLIDCYLVINIMPQVRDPFWGPLTEDNFKSPDLIFWCRVASIIWALSVAAAVIYFVRAIKKRKSAR
jgi:DMSO reductase anchor subunit